MLIVLLFNSPNSEQEILREEIASLQAVKTRLKARVTELEEDLKKTKAELEKAKQGASGAGEDEVRRQESGQKGLSSSGANASSHAMLKETVL